MTKVVEYGFRREGDHYVQIIMTPQGGNFRKRPPRPTGKVYLTLADALKDNQ
jgi:hypothetical protein